VKKFPSVDTVVELTFNYEGGRKEIVGEVWDL
jgi:hypothetical protein